MFGFARRARPIAIDVGHESVKMLQLTAFDRALAVVAASRRARTDAAFRYEGALAALLRQMLADGQFVGRRAVAALPAEIVHTRTIRLPLEPVDLLDAIRTEWPHLYGFDMDAAAVRFVHAGLVRQDQMMLREVIVFAAQKAQVSAFHNELQSAGLSIESLQVGPVAAHSALGQTQRNDRTTAMLDIGAARSTLIVACGSNLTFVKSFDIGGRDFEEAVAHRLSLDQMEARHLLRRIASATQGSEPRRDPVTSAVFDATRALAENLGRQVATCLRYHAITFRGRKPSELLLAGGQSSDLNIQRALSAALGIATPPMNPMCGIDTSTMRPAEHDTRGGCWAKCVGLGLLDTRAAVANSAERTGFANIDQSTAPANGSRNIPPASLLAA